MRIAIGTDHGGFVLRDTIIQQLRALGHTVVDCGAETLNPEDDYPDFAQKVGQALQRGDAERGVVLCGSGVGASIAATKMHGIRAALCHDTYSAHQGVEHDDMNVLCLGARIVGDALAQEIVRAFVTARYSGGERFQRRLDKVTSIEKSAGAKL